MGGLRGTNQRVGICASKQRAIARHAQVAPLLVNIVIISSEHVGVTGAHLCCGCNSPTKSVTVSVYRAIVLRVDAP